VLGDERGEGRINVIMSKTKRHVERRGMPTPLKRVGQPRDIHVSFIIGVSSKARDFREFKVYVVKDKGIRFKPLGEGSSA
jgi:hypothetical protein